VRVKIDEASVWMSHLVSWLCTSTGNCGVVVRCSIFSSICLACVPLLLFPFLLSPSIYISNSSQSISSHEHVSYSSCSVSVGLVLGVFVVFAVCASPLQSGSGCEATGYFSLELLILVFSLGRSSYEGALSFVGQYSYVIVCSQCISQRAGISKLHVGAFSTCLAA